MKIIKVNLGQRAYNILIGNNILKSTGKFIRKLDIGSDAYIVTNRTVKKKYAAALSASLNAAGFNVKIKLVPDTERSKSLKTAYSLINGLSVYGRKRKPFIIAFGGGVIGDLAGFTASIYKRGIAYIQVPTTLLAQVDSAIGGKTGVDLENAKNLVGAFYQPRLVVSDISLLKSLAPVQIQSGLAEIIKYGAINDPLLFKYVEKNTRDILMKKLPCLEFIVNRSSRIKAKIVSKDEQEKKGIRTTLNFGHTIGHAIETAGGYKKYNHGQAIALGMLVAADISVKLALTDNRLPERLERIIKRAGLPTRIKEIPLTKIIAAHYLDKKFSGKVNRFVLIEKIGKTKIIEAVPKGIIKAALKSRYLNKA